MSDDRKVRNWRLERGRRVEDGVKDVIGEIERKKRK
jgi:hypothetical protein